MIAKVRLAYRDANDKLHLDAAKLPPGECAKTDELVELADLIQHSHADEEFAHIHLTSPSCPDFLVAFDVAPLAIDALDDGLDDGPEEMSFELTHDVVNLRHDSKGGHDGAHIVITNRGFKLTHPEDGGLLVEGTWEQAGVA
jgi:hypothetical protein